MGEAENVFLDEEDETEEENLETTIRKFNLHRALAFPNFIAPKCRIPDAAGVYHEAQCVRNRILLGEDDGEWLSKEVLRKLRFEDTDDEEEEEDMEITEADGKCDDDQGIDVEDAAYEKFLMRLDPNDWKNQDHYKVLGLKKLRWAATPDQIRTAFRKKVLRHHPDKRRHRGEAVKDEKEDYFTCITRAHETLSHKTKRRAYDSVDPKFDDKVPTTVLKGEERMNFFKIFAPAFETNSRWSTVHPVPVIGDGNSDYEHVNEFYSFWFEFTTWREFSYLDEEDKEKGENRFERRWIEKENKAERDKRRKDEIRRIRNLVETAYLSDPRIAKYKEDEKTRKQQEKKAKLDAVRLKREAEEKARMEAENLEKERKAAEEKGKKQKRDEEKKEKEKRRKMIQKEKKLFQSICTDNDYFADTDDERMKRMDEYSKLDALLSVEKLQALNADLTSPNGKTTKEIFISYNSSGGLVHPQEWTLSKDNLEELERSIEEEKERSVVASREDRRKAQGESGCEWREEELQLLVKASNLFPVGTKSRYVLIADYINEHRKEDKNHKPKTAKDVIAKAKNLSHVESTSKDLPLAATVIGSKKSNSVQAPPTERTERAGGEGEWTAEEQKLLEQALRSTPSSTAERWERIAEKIPGRTKKDCIKRYKELAEMVKAKKAAQLSGKEKV